MSFGARRFSAERPEHQARRVGEIEAGPIHLRQRVVDQGREISGVGDEVALVFQQRADLLLDQVVIGLTFVG